MLYRTSPALTRLSAIVAPAATGWSGRHFVNDVVAVVNAAGPFVTYGCGCFYAVSYCLSLYGEIRALEADAVRARLECGRCLLTRIRDKNGSIRCSLCGRIILSGDACAIFDRKPSDNKHWAAPEDGGVIGCMRLDCNPNRAFFATGNWRNGEFRRVVGNRQRPIQNIPGWAVPRR